MNRGRRITAAACCVFIACLTLFMLWVFLIERGRPYRSGDTVYNLGVDRGIIDTQLSNYDATTLEMDRGEGMLLISIGYSPTPPLVRGFYTLFPIFRPPNPLELRPEYTQDTRCIAFIEELVRLPDKEQTVVWKRFIQGYKAGHAWIEKKTGSKPSQEK